MKENTTWIYKVQYNDENYGWTNFRETFWNLDSAMKFAREMMKKGFETRVKNSVV